MTEKKIIDPRLDKDELRLLLKTLDALKGAKECIDKGLITPKPVADLQLSGRGAGLEPEMIWIHPKPRNLYSQEVPDSPGEL